MTVKCLTFFACVLLFISMVDFVAAKKKVVRNETDPKVEADTAFANKVEAVLSPWFNINFIENMTESICESMANGTTLSQVFSTYKTPWGLLPLIYPLADEPEIMELNTTIAILSTAFSPWGPQMAVDFAINHFDVFNAIFAPMAEKVQKGMKKGESNFNQACANGINEATKIITKARVQKIIDEIKANYTEPQCNTIYDALNPNMFNLDLYKFSKKDCTGQGPSLAQLVALNNNFNLTGVEMTVPPTTCE